jgi:hypothetical protein
MDDWDLLFLQAAGKSTSSSSTSSSSKLKRNISDGKIMNHDSNADKTVCDIDYRKQSQHKQTKKARMVQLRGTASNNLQHAGFRFSDTSDFKMKVSLAAQYRIVDAWKEQNIKITEAQSIIRAMYVLVRNSRAIGFAPSLATSIKSTAPIRHAYRRKKSLVHGWLVELHTLAATCPEVILTRQYVRKSIDAIESISKEAGESDDEGRVDARELTTEKALRKEETDLQRRKMQTRNCRVSCLRLIAALDAIYGGN